MGSNASATELNSQAEEHKQRGNNLYAIRVTRKPFLNTRRQFPNTVAYYTNRALCYQKLNFYVLMEQDCRRAIDIDKNAAKAHFLLSKALLGQPDCEAEVVNVLKKAYKLALQQKLPFVDDILNELRPARRRLWERKERLRLEEKSDMFAYLRQLIANDHKRACEELPLISDTDMSAEERNQINGEMESSLNDEFSQRFQQLDLLFAQADENMKKREIPDYFINFEIMHDPVTTPSGITYERNELLNHLKQIGSFDPLSRKPLYEHNLVPNLALREAIEEFLANNGWAADQ
ncbi:U-box domain-containing protein [Syncephalis fuscata]|nr:U-box domain-containing protein [Syncephalis fuscata]